MAWSFEGAPKKGATRRRMNPQKRGQRGERKTMIRELGGGNCGRGKNRPCELFGKGEGKGWSRLKDRTGKRDAGNAERVAPTLGLGQGKAKKKEGEQREFVGKEGWGKEKRGRLIGEFGTPNSVIDQRRKCRRGGGKVFRTRLKDSKKNGKGRCSDGSYPAAGREIHHMKKMHISEKVDSAGPTVQDTRRKINSAPI